MRLANVFRFWINIINVRENIVKTDIVKHLRKDDLYIDVEDGEAIKITKWNNWANITGIEMFGIQAGRLLQNRIKNRWVYKKELHD